ncbi:hypothetical protein ACFSGX_08465 [Sphingomonas arantia]|uniref:Uncharacterized protein n=1 Tax=Sphingomonas arantia TaxID=1460676 RepID=A0ABW4TZT1_9SPHN
MFHAFRTSLHPLKAMNRRALIGAAGLTLLILGQTAMALMAPFA